VMWNPEIRDEGQARLTQQPGRLRGRLWLQFSTLVTFEILEEICRRDDFYAPLLAGVHDGKVLGEITCVSVGAGHHWRLVTRRTAWSRVRVGLLEG
jgi:hypothetical protein